jgi:hypothetical protein
MGAFPAAATKGSVGLLTNQAVNSWSPPLPTSEPLNPGPLIVTGANPELVLAWIPILYVAFAGPQQLEMKHCTYTSYSPSLSQEQLQRYLYLGPTG